MIREQTVEAILEMHEKDIPIKNICRLLKVSRNTVRQVIREQGAVHSAKTSGYEKYLPLLREAFRRCQGNAVRVMEVLSEEQQTNIPYTTLTWLIRRHGHRGA